jgi:hypothetical protein
MRVSYELTLRVLIAPPINRRGATRLREAYCANGLAHEPHAELG